MCAHASTHTCMCTHTMHTGLITLANMIHSPMNVLHTPDMEPTSVRNKPEYLSTAAGCKPWRIEHVLPKPGCSFIRIIKFLKGLVSCQVYLYTYTVVEVGDTSKRCFDTILSICMVYLQYENTIPALPFRKIEISVQGKKKTYDNVAFTLSSCFCLDASCELNYIKFARNGVSVLYRWYP